MATLKYKCPECECRCEIVYKEDECESDPSCCPFCGEYIQNELGENDD